VVAVNPATGERQVVASAEVGGGATLAPQAITLDGAATRALVSNTLRGEIVAVSLVDGDRTVVSSATTGSGPRYELPLGLAIDPSRGTIVTADPDAHAIFVATPDTGARVILSR
jgi:DNA-binding beta-propeller fold protein YncE